MTKATPRPKMIRAVYDSFDTGRHQGDATARRVMDRVVSWLCGGLELSPRLQGRLIDNINMRTKFVVQSPATPIRLTRDQLIYAMKTNPEWFELGLDGEDLPVENCRKDDENYDVFPQSASDIPTVLRLLSDSITTSFLRYYDVFPIQAHALAQHLVSLSAEKGGCGTTDSLPLDPKVMEREEKECNHEQEVISASHSWHDHDRGEAAMIEEVIGQKLTHEQHELHEPQADQHVERHEPAARQDMTERNGQGERTTSRPTLTLWVKEDDKGDTHATGYLDVGEDKYALRFTRFDHQLERISDNADAEWIADMNSVIAPDLLAVERNHTGIAGAATMSGLYARRDTWARKTPVRSNTALILEWRAGAPDVAHLIEGTNQTTIELRREANDRFKGSIA